MEMDLEPGVKPGSGFTLEKTKAPPLLREKVGSKC
jgi:hypothetical protein